MFGLFKKKEPEVHLRKGVEIGEMRENSLGVLRYLILSTAELKDSVIEPETDDMTFVYNGLTVYADCDRNVLGLSLEVIVPEANIRQVDSISKKAFLYRCTDHICFRVPGATARFDVGSGNLVVGIRSAGFWDQFRADTLIDIALFMLEDAVYEARTYLGLPATAPAPVRVDQWEGGYHFGEGIRTYASARDAFAAYMMKHEQCQEVSRDGQSILLQSGPVQYDVRGFNWPNAYLVSTATRGFKHIYHDDERYVQVQERLAQPIHNPEKPEGLTIDFRSPKDATIAYFQPDGTFVLGQFGFGNVRTDENGKAFERVASAHMVNVYYMTYLAQELPAELYSDEANRPN